MFSDRARAMRSQRLSEAQSLSESMPALTLPRGQDWRDAERMARLRRQVPPELLRDAAAAGPQAC